MLCTERPKRNNNANQQTSRRSQFNHCISYTNICYKLHFWIFYLFSVCGVVCALCFVCAICSCTIHVCLSPLPCSMRYSDLYTNKETEATIQWKASMAHLLVRLLRYASFLHVWFCRFQLFLFILLFFSVCAALLVRFVGTIHNHNSKWPWLRTYIKLV